MELRKRKYKKAWSVIIASLLLINTVYAADQTTQGDVEIEKIVSIESETDIEEISLPETTLDSEQEGEVSGGGEEIKSEEEQNGTIEPVNMEQMATFASLYTEKTQLFFDIELNAVMTSITEEHYYEFTADKDGVYELELDKEKGQYLEFTVYDQNNRMVRNVKDPDKYGENFAVLAGKYTVVVKAYANTIGQYSIVLKKYKMVESDEVSTPHNTYENAQSIDIYQGFTGLLCGLDGTEVYKIQVPNNGKFEFSYTLPKYTTFKLLDANQNVCYEFYRGAFSLAKFTQYIPAGVYYISIEGDKTKDDHYGGEYTMSAVLSQLNSEDQEPNDTPANANKIAINGGFTVGCLLYGDSADVYKFQVMQEDTIKMNYLFDISVGSSYGGSLDVKLTDTQGKEYLNKTLFSSSKGEDIEVALKPGVYYLTISNKNRDTGTYNFKLESGKDQTGGEQLKLLTAFVNRMYTECLNRQGDLGGIEAWVGELMSGNQTGAQLAKAFIGSDEFKGRNLSNEEYIRVMYRAFLGREADIQGFNSWTDMLNTGVTRNYVLAQFVGSAEYQGICNSYGIIKGNIELTQPEDLYLNITQFIYRLYEKTLSRVPDETGLNYWVSALSNGQVSGVSAAANFLYSNEFLAKNTSHEEFIGVLYGVYFNRLGDAGGIKYWKDYLSSGYSRQEVINGFGNSDEFKAICATYGIKHK